MDFTVESIREGDEDQRHELRRQAFGRRDEHDPSAPVLDRDRTVAAYDGERLVGTAVALDFRMHWCGAAVPCGGVADVIVRPEDRGRGIAKALLRETFDRMTGRGEVISALYPTTASLYQGLGYEICGAREWRRIPIHLMPADPEPHLSWQRVDMGHPSIRAIHESMAPTVDGWAHADDAWWANTRHEIATQRGTNRFCYLGSRDGTDVAAVLYRYDESETRLYDLGVELLAGLDSEAIASTFAFLGSNGTAAGNVETTLPRSLLDQHIPQMQLAKIANDWPWMFRVVDAAGAITARGWPSGVSGQIHLDIADDVISSNNGRWTLSIDGGAARLEPGGSGDVRVDVRDLASLYTGGDARVLHAGGRLPGATPADVDLLAAAFVAHPSMSFFF